MAINFYSHTFLKAKYSTFVETRVHPLQDSLIILPIDTVINVHMYTLMPRLRTGTPKNSTIFLVNCFRAQHTGVLHGYGTVHGDHHNLHINVCPQFTLGLIYSKLSVLVHKGKKKQLTFVSLNQGFATFLFLCTPWAFL